MASAAALDSALGAISSGTRRRLLDALAKRERTVTELVRVARVSQPAVSQHLRVLREAGLVGERREGRYRVYRLEAAPLAAVLAWVQAYERFWTERLAALGTVLDEVNGRD